MSTLYIRHPARISVESATSAGAGSDELHAPALGVAPACRFALVSEGGTVMQQGATVLGNLGELIAQAGRVVLLLAASDVSLLKVKAPPLAGARLKAALPALVEEQLIDDPAACVIVPATTVASALETADGLLRVAVVQRAWLELLVQALAAQGARQVAALPAQLCLPAPDLSAIDGPAVHCAVGEPVEGDIDVAMRLGAYDGLGLAMPASSHDADASAGQVLATLQALAGPSALHVHAPASQLASYERAAQSRNAALAGAGAAITVSQDQWSHWIAGARAQTLDLMAGLNLRVGGADWKRWRWPLGLAAALALLNIAALNADWWRLQREADAEQAQLVRTYKTAYPNETVIIDPVAQMAQKVAAARAASGMSSPDDFLALASTFSQVWSGQTAGRAGIAPIAQVDYRERALVVRFEAGNAPFEEMRAALAGRQLALTQPGANTWEIRSAK